MLAGASYRIVSYRGKRSWHRADLLWKTTFAQQWATTANKDKQQLKEEDVPIHYQIYHNVFSEEEAEQLPPSCQEDMMINLKEGALEQLDCKVYPLTTKEMDILWETLKSDLAKGYICPETSSYISPIFFIPKKDGKELWMVIDYRKLNNITKKDFYPLPNLRTELEKLSQHHLFSKFNVRAGYNNIHIRKEDQEKAAFKTPLGMFISTVMTFGFYNALSIFQRAINQDLKPLKQKYSKNFANYMDDIAIGTKDSPEGRALHKKIVHEFLETLEQHSYYLKVSKSKFEKPNMEFLGFCIGLKQSKWTRVKLVEFLIGPKHFIQSKKCTRS